MAYPDELCARGKSHSTARAKSATGWSASCTATPNLVPVTTSTPPGGHRYGESEPAAAASSPAASRYELPPKDRPRSARELRLPTTRAPGQAWIQHTRGG
jgi:hypothetical protein